MSQVLSWKEKAKQACSAKGLYSLNNERKDLLCEEALKKLSEINLDGKKAQDTLKTLRGD